MAIWAADELDKIGNAEELMIAPMRMDGSFRNYLPIWVVRVDDDLFIRSVNGITANWYIAAQVCHKGKILAGGIEKMVNFDHTSQDLEQAIDNAYREKYQKRYPGIISSINSPIAKMACIKLVVGY